MTKTTGLGARSRSVSRKTRPDWLRLEEAVDLLVSTCPEVIDVEVVGAGEALGRICRVSPVAAVSIPPQDLSAVDGYVLPREALDWPAPYRLPLGSGPAAAARVVTGGLVYDAAGAVVMQELCEASMAAIRVLKSPYPGENIRRRGEDVVQGNPLFASPCLIDARHMAILAAAGAETVRVSRKLRIRILCTGSELQVAATRLEDNAIYNSNGPLLRALLSNSWIDIRGALTCSDDVGVVRDAILSCTADADLLVTTGGLFGSENDNVSRALVELGVSPRRCHVRMKPGRVISLARVNGCQVCSLPGNTTAVFAMTLFLLRALMANLAGLPPLRPRPVGAIAGKAWKHGAGTLELVPGRMAKGPSSSLPMVTPLPAKRTHLRPWIEADGLIAVAADVADVTVGTAVDFYPFESLLR